ncbi:N-carbamoylputrescine amidase [Clostridium saccharoperbutylacetonicum]|uniref:N-carbamoylputrescine amidase n=1 Tax=Clostridium saccharoperbutylacetonicum N1-4(HMT) TaxID=931276 RepID=M1MIS7_9CLOT|nr:N-carbamoylputrescine amidase [Clostridium saccharoperbutylacetonicum]AGF56228.1 N-carbamoylputrescine amidase [Clostridium saccharoperbutylacetonicum N1-4(HMT)]AQR94968.1 N-carbamoyl-D-amino acid hydrolase [Clostridium saccharoperbutylacetonicum]NRT63029.1 N-carbamoylputrescine amidase [Clostridium saccharoperbutylacetonicum]NSB26386.1 N-carbamoylputrescine amidase [Clostridium saccharoperbutylacetonicum]NSB30811.1 N-carbamoylputrescine amidase [Clostridium saccharoperbutylacetonicum]
MRNVKVAATQMSCSNNIDENISKAEQFVRDAADKGAQIILLQELFETPYFCQKEKSDYYVYASTVEENRAINHFKKIAKELKVVLPISFYEKKNYARYNSIAIIDADGEVLGTYRKSHIPDGPGYEEKFYFNPGDTGFKVWNTRYGKIGVGICWDQWYPEAARCMTLMGAEILFYPTAIGSEPQDGSIDSKDHWQACMLGHAASNLIPVIASNRVGIEADEDSKITFYGSSFIAGPQGNKIVEANRTEETVLVAEFDLDQLENQRIEWGIFRDRRPDLYKIITSYDGELIIK